VNIQDKDDNRLETFVITTLEQARLLADEFKLRVLLAFAEQPATVKQVADELGEKQTRLYRHVDALLEAGLLNVIEEKQKRGTVERTLQAVASRFKAEPSLFQGESDDETHAPIRAQFQRAADAFLKSLSADARSQSRVEPVCLRILNRVSPERLEELHRLLMEWVERAGSEESDNDEMERCDFSALIVFSEDPQ
jgi:DNA-binding MarR family transcriptional regulator